MQIRPVGRSGLAVSRLALGTRTWGRETDEDDAAAQLTAFADAGGTLLDTADVYGGGETERIVGRLLRDVVPRGNVVLATKASGRTARGPMGRGSSRGHLLDALDASLGRLGVDHVDLWQLYAFDDSTPLEETLAALDTAVQSGRARYVGVSNFAGWQTAKAATWQRSWPGRAPLVATQVEWSLLQRGVEREVVPAAQDAGMGVLPWSPLARGVLTGRYRHGAGEARGGTSATREYLSRYLDDRSARVVEAVATAAEGLGTTPLAVALAWVRDRPGVVAPIVGARTVKQLGASLAVESLTLPDRISAALDDASAPEVGYPERPIS